MNQLPTLWNLFFLTPFCPSRRSEQQGFLSDRTGEAKLSKREVSGLLCRVGEDRHETASLPLPSAPGEAA